MVSGDCGECARVPGGDAGAEAFNKITAAQTANEWDLGGHAAKAKDLLEQADKELKLAAETANKNKK